MKLFAKYHPRHHASRWTGTVNVTRETATQWIATHHGEEIRIDKKNRGIRGRDDKCTFHTVDEYVADQGLMDLS